MLELQKLLDLIDGRLRVEMRDHLLISDIDYCLNQYFLAPIDLNLSNQDIESCQSNPIIEHHSLVGACSRYICFQY